MSNVIGDRRNPVKQAHAFIDSDSTAHLFPVRKHHKAPPLFSGCLALASNNHNQIDAWEKRWPGSNWALALAKSRRLVVDFDCKPGKRGAQTRADLEARGFIFPETRKVLTPSGGYHLHYKGRHVFALGTDGFGPDVDSPNYVMLPGTEIVGGDYPGVYHYDNAMLPVANAPPWFYGPQFLGQPREKTERVETPVVDLDQTHNVDWYIDYLVNDSPPSVEGSPEGGERVTLRVAMTARDHGISEGMCLELMNRYYNVEGKCDPTWDIDGPNGLEKKINNAYLYANISAPGGRTAEADFAEPYIGTLPSIKRPSQQRSSAQHERAAQIATPFKPETEAEKNLRLKYNASCKRFGDRLRQQKQRKQQDRKDRAARIAKPYRGTV